MQAAHWERPLNEKRHFVRSLPDAQCRHCNATFRPSHRDRTSYCSRPCAFAGRAADKAARLAAKVAERSQRVYPKRNCSECSTEFRSSQTHQLYCSKPCSTRASEKRNRLVDRSARRCAECDTAFAPDYGSKRRRFCSDGCAKRAARRPGRIKRKAKQRAASVETVDPLKVFERDGWRCQLCGVKTPRSKRGSIHPRAPELDHIVPLAAGGEHSYRNTQCACRACNARKGARPLGQPRLL